ncbi:MAG: CoA ester lyase [Acidimicrobiaceae bacterium]|jgi:citrate lyase subunit beta/citryl-CoA lyase|nr:CoA ester lyase [Acidimicrobiaceae bacterium]MEC7427028.1 CoA ester lyase [Actinomycetota bacterium]HAE54475.1 CoA ester lyase [Acidimicrobiaceae bacterium]|tara:strand:+ start:3063 stop:3953 length:891 start_codon:yes stop_codon:yes gene_type:complete
MTIRRAAHFVPGANEKMLNKSLETAADALILDLEDAVTPENKDSARVTVSDWLEHVDFGRQERVVRVNPLGSPWFERDVEETMGHPPDSYLIPKVNNANEVAEIDATIREHERSFGHTEGAVKLLILGTETPQGFLNIGDLAANPRVDALTWGAEDLSAAIGSRANRNPDGSYLPIFEHARVMCLLAATAWDKQPLDTVFVDFNDPSGLRSECLESANMGYTGKITIHPNQIEIVNECFTPSPAEVSEAKELLDLFAAKEAEGVMAFSFKGQMVDVPHLTRAKKIVEMSEALAGLG